MIYEFVSIFVLLPGFSCIVGRTLPLSKMGFRSGGVLNVGWLDELLAVATDDAADVVDAADGGSWSGTTWPAFLRILLMEETEGMELGSHTR